MLDSVGGATEERRSGILEERHSLKAVYNLRRTLKGVSFILICFIISWHHVKLNPMLSAHIHPMPS